MKISVGIGELSINKAPVILETRGLGSCVGVALYDEVKKIGALAHVMLPSSRISSNYDEDNFNTRFRYADYSIPYIIDKMNHMGSLKSNLVAKIIGGASMFKRKSNTLNIGNQNVEAVRKVLINNNIKIAAEEVGGEIGRTVIFDLSSGAVLIKIYGINKQEIEI